MSKFTCRFLFLLVSAIFLSCHQVRATAVISEFLASNEGGFLDEDGASSDWVEIYNAGTNSVNLDQWSITDDSQLQSKWIFPSVNIPAGGYIIVFASGKDRSVAGSELHTNFSLAKSGSYLALFPPTGNATTEFSPTYPPQETGLSYGGSGADAGYFLTTTPKAINSAKFDGLLSDTNFTQGRGIYYTAFIETVSCADLGATIIYTLDGTEPSLTNGTQVQAANAASTPSASVSISTTTVLRAIAVKSNYRSTNIDTVTYLFPQDVLTQDDTFQGSQLPLYPYNTNFGAFNWSYEMDSKVVNDPRYADIASDLLELPTMSIVLPVEDIWGSNGILSNPIERGPAWERSCSVEIIDPITSDNYQINAGLRVQGQSSRFVTRGKKSLRLAFRKQYGESRFKYPLWGATGSSEASSISLRANPTDSWTEGYDSGSIADSGRSSALLLRSHFSTKAHSLTGAPAVSSGWVHLYLNGKYWGLYNPVERADREFAAIHGGGSEDDYYRQSLGTDSEGDSTDWDTLNTFIANYTSNYDEAKHQEILSNVEPDQLIDYLITNFWVNNGDWFNNWVMLRNNKHNGPFTFYMWDCDASLYAHYDPTALRSNFPPALIHHSLKKSPEYRLQFADRVHKLMFNNGIFATANAQQLFQSTADEIQASMNCEAARWGDELTPTAAYNTADHWLPQVSYRKGTWMPLRHSTLLNQLRNQDLYPDTEAPVYSMHGGTIVSGDSIIITNPNSGENGTIYFTTDGNDPRLAGGSVSSSAQEYTSAVVLNANTTVKSRVLFNGEWSALNEARFTTGVIPTASSIVISEIHYHPANPTTAEVAAGFLDSDDFEFIELLNTSSASLDLSSLTFDNSAEGIGFDFSTLSNPLLAPGEHIVLAKNLNAYALRYGNAVTPAGAYSGKLSNGGETLTLTQGSSQILLSFTYNDKYPWPETPDGDGPSLVLIDPTQTSNLNIASNWGAAGQLHGTPGVDEITPTFPTNPAADSNGNGVADIIDYAIADSSVGANVHADGNDYLTISFRSNPSAGKASLTIEYSENLTQWSSANDKVAHVSESYNPDGSVTYVWQSLTPMNQAASVKQFLRVKVTEKTTP